MAGSLLQSGALVQAFEPTCVLSSRDYALWLTVTAVSEPQEQLLGWLQVACTWFTKQTFV